MHETFLKAILAKPEDDGPRLVYADYLEEAGFCERSELIRVQCAIASGVTEEQDCGRCVNGIITRAKGTGLRPGSARHLGGRRRVVTYRTMEPEIEEDLCRICNATGKVQGQKALKTRESQLLRGFHHTEMGFRKRPVKICNHRAWEHETFPGSEFNGFSAGESNFVRGFIDCAIVSLRTFLGGRCQTCSGTGRLGRKACQLCNGDGHIVGLAPYIFSRAPISYVSVWDKSPTGEYDGYAMWTIQDVASWGREYLPREIFDLLPPPGSSERFRIYPGVSDAEQALSSACVAYGRRAAGLPVNSAN